MPDLSGGRWQVAGFIANAIGALARRASWITRLRDIVKAQRRDGRRTGTETRQLCQTPWPGAGNPLDESCECIARGVAAWPWCSVVLLFEGGGQLGVSDGRLRAG